VTALTNPKKSAAQEYAEASFKHRALDSGARLGIVLGYLKSFFWVFG
jgi:hypothetical protein